MLATALGFISCATSYNVATDVGKEYSDAIFEYGISFNSSVHGTAPGFEDAYRSFASVERELENSVNSITNLSKDILEDDALAAKIAERDALQKDYDEANWLEKKFKKSKLEDAVNTVEKSMTNKEKVDKLKLKLPALTAEYASSKKFEAEMEQLAIKTLKEKAGFNFVDDEKVLATAKKELDKRERKAKSAAVRGAIANIFKGIAGVATGSTNALSGGLNVAGGAFDIVTTLGIDEEEDPKAVLSASFDDDMRKALKKGTKCNSFVSVSCRIIPLVYDKEKVDPQYPQSIAVITTVKIKDEKGKVLKAANGYVKSEVLTQAEVKDNPSVLTSQIPDLVIASIDYVISNLHVYENRRNSPGYPRSVNQDVTDMQKKWSF